MTPSQASRGVKTMRSRVPPPARGSAAEGDDDDEGDSSDGSGSEGDEALDEWLDKRSRAVEKTREEVRRAREAKEAEALAACTFAPTLCGGYAATLRDNARRDARAWQASEGGEEG